MPFLSPKPRTETARAAAVLIRERLVACGSLREYLPRLPSTYKYNIPWRMSKAPDSALTARSHARGNCDASGALAKGERPGAVVQACSVCRSSCALDDKYIRRGNRQQLDWEIFSVELNVTFLMQPTIPGGCDLTRRSPIATCRLRNRPPGISAAWR